MHESTGVEIEFVNHESDIKTRLSQFIIIRNGVGNYEKALTVVNKLYYVVFL